eukprot:8278283-Pyramimonas_sp.AAC.1
MWERISGHGAISVSVSVRANKRADEQVRACERQYQRQRQRKRRCRWPVSYRHYTPVIGGRGDS